jgi:type I restriction enzyme M protein
MRDKHLKSDDFLDVSNYGKAKLILYNGAQKEYPNVLGGEKRVFCYDLSLRPIKISDEKFLVGLMEAFQRRAILKARNESFNQIIFNNFSDTGAKVDNDQFYTPIPVVKTIIKMINPTKQEEVCDPCCGLCDFPAMAYRHTHDKDEPFPLSATNLYGFDIAKGNIKLAELNLVLNGDGGAVLEEMKSLSQKLMKNGKVIENGDFNTNNYDPITWNHLNDSSQDIKKYKIITTNPPFGKGRDLKTGASGKWDLKNPN